MKRRRGSRRIRTAVWLGLVVVIVTDLVALDGTISFIDTARRAEKALVAADRLEDLLSLLTDAETGQRGYLITGDERYLAPYRDAVGRLDRATRELRALLVARVHQQERLDALAPLLAAKLDELRRTIELRRAGGFEAARRVVVTDEGLGLMSRIREQLGIMVERERARYDPQREAAGATWILTAIGMGTAVGVATLIAAVFWLGREADRRREGDQRRPAGHDLGGAIP